MKKSIFAISSLLTLTTGVVFGQQEKLLTHFIYDRMSINPGSTGMDQGISGTMVYRNQWDKVNGAPNSFLFNAEGNINSIANAYDEKKPYLAPRIETPEYFILS